MRYFNPVRVNEREVNENKSKEAMKETHTAEMIDMQIEHSLFSPDTNDPRVPLRRAAARASIFFRRAMNAARFTIFSTRALALLIGRLIVWFSQPRQLRRAVACLLMLALFTDSNKALGHAIFTPAPGERLLNHNPAPLPSPRSKSNGFLSSLASGLSTVATAFETVFDLLFPFDEESSLPKTKSSWTPAAKSSLRLPRIEAVDVKDDSRSGFARLIIRGSNFHDESLVVVGESELQVTRASFDQIIALAPAALRREIATGSSSLRVINPDARQASWIKTASEEKPVQGKSFDPFSVIHTLFSASAEPLFQAPAQQISAAISQHTPSLNTGRIEGSLRVFEGAQWNINGGFQLTGDMFVVGTPDIRTNGNASHGGIIDDGGSPAPSGYRINLNGGVQIPGKIHIRADAVALPSDIPTSVPQPAGTRSININSATDVNNVGDWATVRDLNVNSPNVTIDVPPGNYGRFTLNSACRLNFTSGIYNFAQNLHLNGGTSVQATGAVTITIGETMAINGGAILPGQGTGSGNIRLIVLGSSLNLNGVTDVTGLVRAPNSQVHLNGTSKVRGQVIAGTLN
ncbi:MAG TPA: IPT/TIG domain-containing protein, partial [Blastocatellia bacterium]